MASGRTRMAFFILLVIVASTGCVSAEQQSEGSKEEHDSSEEHQDRAGLFGLPNFGQLFGLGNSNGSDPFSQLVSTFGQFFPGLGGSNNTGSGFPNLFSAFLPHGRSEQVALPDDLRADNNGTSGTEDGPTPHDRFFFFLFNHFFNHFIHNNQNQGNSYVTIGCNYTEQGAYSCAGCREQLICMSSNVGQLRICPNNTPYCYMGSCGTYVNATCTNSTG